jgi:hypothetical protein
MVLDFAGREDRSRGWMASEADILEFTFIILT